MSLIHSPYATVQARAVAQQGSSPNCVYVMNTAKSGAMQLSGTVNASCGTFVNSSSATALKLQGGSSLTSTTIQVVGGYSTSAASVSPVPTTGATAITDPLASLTQPSFSACTYTYTKINSTTGSQTLSPGTIVVVSQ